MTTKNTDLVANQLASPQVLNNAAELHGVLRTACGTVELAAGDSTDNDVVLLAPLPSKSTINQLYVGSDDFGGSCTFNVGVHNYDGTVADEDCFATAVADDAAMADVRHEVATINTVGQKLWEIAGLTSDPGGLLYVSITFAATGGTAGTLSWNVSYAVN
tara:strand:- start:516 stop:995 length:480 start_codon:yes stop_codon:yes gene_type:complete